MGHEWYDGRRCDASCDVMTGPPDRLSAAWSSSFVCMCTRISLEATARRGEAVAGQSLRAAPFFGSITDAINTVPSCHQRDASPLPLGSVLADADPSLTHAPWLTHRD